MTKSSFSFPVVVSGLDDGGEDIGLLDDECHNNGLVDGGLIVATSSGEDGVLLHSSLQKSVAKCRLDYILCERTRLISLYWFIQTMIMF
jgi:hypothetical protein